MKKSNGESDVLGWTKHGAVLGPFLIEGSINQFVYKELLEQKVLPLLKHRATREQLNLMQDGATCHTTPINLEFLRSKLVGSVISNKTDLPWPPNSPDLNPLDFFFWGHSINYVVRTKPSTIWNLKSIVIDFAESMDSDLVQRECESAKIRFEKLRQERGSHFDHLL